MPDWPLVRWTIYGRWSDCGRYVYSTAPHVTTYERDEIIYTDYATTKEANGERRS